MASIRPPGHPERRRQPHGTTYADYLGGYGTVFRIAPDGTSFTNLLYFDGCDDARIRKRAVRGCRRQGLWRHLRRRSLPNQQGTLFCSPAAASQHHAQPAGRRWSAAPTCSSAWRCRRPAFAYQWKRNGPTCWTAVEFRHRHAQPRLSAVSLADSTTYSVTSATPSAR